jgi:hypothetical protein
MEVFNSDVKWSSEAVKKIIEDYYHNSKRIRIYLGSKEKKDNIEYLKIWPEIYDIIGYVGKTSNNYPILVNKINGTGGPIILTDCIVGLQDVKTKKFLYKLPEFKDSNYEVVYDEKNGIYKVIYTIKIGKQIVYKEVIYTTPNKIKAENNALFFRGERMKHW